MNANFLTWNNKTNQISRVWEGVLKFLRARSVVAGLEISDSALRFTYFNGRSWQLTGVRIPPGLMENGRLKNADALVAALKALREQIFNNKKEHRRLNVVVSFSSLNIYTQTFNLPLVEGESVDRAIDLNLRMIAPADFAEVYAGWEILTTDKSALTLEVLSAFISRETIDAYHRAFVRAGFLAVAVESRALSLARLLRLWAVGFNVAAPALVLNVDASGVDIIIVRSGRMYFEYFTLWREVQGAARQISADMFRAAIVRNINQVLNFHQQHWPEPLRQVFVAAVGMESQVEKVMREEFPALSVRQLRLRHADNIPPQWFIALGGGIRGATPRGKDKDITLSGSGIGEEFHRQHILTFLGFWRIILPAALSVLLIAFVGVDLFLAKVRGQLAAELARQGNVEKTKELNQLEAQVGEFNQAVAMVQAAGKAVLPKHAALESLKHLAEDRQVTLQSLSITSAAETAQLTGTAASEEQILQFKKALEQSAVFKNIVLPITQIKSGVQGVSFAVSFQIDFSALAKAS